MDETSLDDFLDSEGDGETAHEADDVEADEADDAADVEADGERDTAASAQVAEDEQSPVPEGDPATVEPAATTYQWTPAGATCAACGEQTERRWHSDDGLVCPDCKEW